MDETHGMDEAYHEGVNHFLVHTQMKQEFLNSSITWIFHQFEKDCSQVSNLPIFEKLVEESIRIGPMVLLVCILVSVIWALAQTYSYWRWTGGHTDNCSNCGGMVTHKNGRYGFYVHCLACGKNRSY